MTEQSDPEVAVPLDTVRERPGGRSARIRADVLEATRRELADNGYGALSHRVVAQRAGVDPATVYRRWPTRARLVTDALLEFASEAVPVPDTGTVEGDLTTFLGDVVRSLAHPTWRAYLRALSAAAADAEADLRQVVRTFWETRFAGAEGMIVRACERGELPTGANPHDVIEVLVSPAYFRTLITGERPDEGFTRRCVAHALAAARV